MTKRTQVDKNLAKSIVIYFILFLIFVLGVVFYAKYLPKNSFSANSETMELQANLEKYINYKLSDEDKGTLLQIGVKSGIKDNNENNKYIPVKQSQIKLELSKIDNKYPFKVSVIGKSTEATNGKKEDIKEDYRYDERLGSLIINTSNLNENGELIKKENTSKEALDEYTVICYYDTYTEKTEERIIEVKGEAIALLSEDDRLVNRQECFKGEVKDNIRELTSLEYHTDEIANGYIKSNIINDTNYDTEYTETQNIVISKKENQDKIEISENNSFVKNENEEDQKIDLGNNNEIMYKNTVLYKNNIFKMLGEDGKLEIFDNEQNKITEIDKNTQFNEDGTIIVNYEKDITSLIIRTSKIENEGILKIKNTKLIKSTMRNAENISIKTITNIKGVKEIKEQERGVLQNNNITEKIVYNNQQENISEIKNASTNIDVNISKTDWTNKEQNEVDFSISLKSTNMNDNMFMNPKIKIQLPDEVEKVILGESYMVYGGQLQLENVSLEKDEQGKQNIFISVKGIQNNYYSNDLELIPNIKIPATIILKKDIENSDSNINFKYINEFTTDKVQEEKEYNKEISLVDYKEQNTIINNSTNSMRRLIKADVATSKEEDNNDSNIKTEVSLYRGDKEIKEKDVLYEGEYIKYNIHVSNISDKDIDNVKVIGTIPEGTIYGELRADYNNYMGEYKYIFDENVSSKEFNIGTLKSGEDYTIYYEVKVKDIEDNIQNIQLESKVETQIGDNIINSINYTNTIEKAEAKVFLGAFLDNAEDRWNYSLKVESQEDKQVEVKVQFPKGFKLETRVQAGGQDGTYNPIDIEADSNNIVTDTIETNKEYWYEGEIDSTLIEENSENEPVVLNAYATARMNGIEYNSNENRIDFEKRSVTVKMTSNNEGEEVYPGENINYEIVVKNTGKTNLNQEDIDVFSVDINDYLPDEVKPISVEYEYWEQVDNNWQKRNTIKDIKNIYTDEQGNKLPNIDLTINIPYNKEIKIKINTIANRVNQKTKIENNTTVKGLYINAKESNTVSHTLVPIPLKNATNITEVNENNGEEDTNNNINNTEEKNNKSNNKSKSISGVAWLDENNDGERQESEQKLSGIEVLLIDVNDQSKIAGKTTTGSDGNYKFNDLNSEKYIIVFKYNVQNYVVTQYKKSGVSDEVNSDANSKDIKLNGETLKAGVTDIITLNNLQENIDIGLIKTGICDLKLDKYISKVTVTTAKSSKQYSYNNQKLAKVEIRSKEIEGATVEVEYKLVVTNEGEVVASPSAIIDYLPEGFDFSKETNENWAMQKNGQLLNTSLSNKKLNPGESCELTLVLTKKMNSNATGQYKNTAEIGEISNSQELKDNDSTPGNNREGEDDYSEATIIISIGTGGLIYIGIIITLICALICTLIILNKKGKLKNKNILKLTKLSIFVVIFAGILFAGDNTSWSDGQIKRQLAYQQLQFQWDPSNTTYRNAYGSTYFKSIIGGAICQNAGLAAFSGQYEFVKATGLVSSSYQTSNEPVISIRKTDDTTGVNIKEGKDANGNTYYVYGPINFTSTFKNVTRENLEYSVSAISGINNVDTKNIIILKNKNEDVISTNGKFNDNQIAAGNNNTKTIYLKIYDQYLSKYSVFRGRLGGFSITASANGEKIKTTKSSGYLHYKVPSGYYQSVKTISRHPAYEYKTTTTLSASMTETWDLMNFNVEIIKSEKNTDKELSNVSFYISTKEKYIVQDSMSDEKIYYKLPDPTKDEKDVVKGYDFRTIPGKGELDPNKEYNEEWTYNKDEATRFITNDEGKAMISNLKGATVTYTLHEDKNENYGYNIGRMDFLKRRVSTNSVFDGYTHYAEGNIQVRYVYNTKITGNLLLNKTDEKTEKPLKGISFKIRKKDGSNNNNYIIVQDQNKIAQSRVDQSFTIGGMEYTENKNEATEFITDENGQIKLYNILEGEYIVEEIGTANYFGYDIDDNEDNDATVKWNTQAKGFKKDITIKSDKENTKVIVFDEEKNGFVVLGNNNEYEFTSDEKMATVFDVGNELIDGKYTLYIRGLPSDTYTVEQYDESEQNNYEENIEKNYSPEQIIIKTLDSNTKSVVLKDEVQNKYLKVAGKAEIIGDTTLEENNTHYNITYVDNKNEATLFKTSNNKITITNKLTNKFKVENWEQNLDDCIIINGTDIYIYGESNTKYKIKNSQGYIKVLNENGEYIENEEKDVILERFEYTPYIGESTNFITDTNNQIGIFSLPEDTYQIEAQDGTVLYDGLKINNRYIGYEITVNEQIDETQEKAKEGLKYCIVKQDEESSKYLILYDENEEEITNVSTATVESIGETPYMNKASILKTDENGKITINNLPEGIYEIKRISEESETGANITYSIKNTDQEEINYTSGSKKEIRINVAKQPSTDTDFANLINITNKKKFIKISGYAFEDKVYGKDSTTDNLYDPNSNDKKLKGINVKLYNVNGDLLDERITGEDGSYIFGDYINDTTAKKIKIEDLEKAYIIFEYNGMHYKTTDVVVEDNEIDKVKDNSTKAIENSGNIENGIGEKREDFNEKYATIEYNKSKNANGEFELAYNYDNIKYASKLNLGENVVYGYEGQEYPTSGVDEKYLLTASTKNVNIKDNMILGQNLTFDDIKKIDVSEITNVNLGLKRREMPDLAISTDINNVEININGYKHTYNGNKRLVEDRSTYSEEEGGVNAIFNATVKADGKYNNASYTRELYEADRKYTGENKLKVYITYEIKVRNEATSLTSTVNSLTNYYDKNYLTPNSYRIIGTNDDIAITNDSITQGYYNNYNKLDLNTLNLQIAHEEEKSVTIKFELRKYEDIIYDTTINNNQAMLDNYTEITSYSTKDSNGNIYAGIDKDSNPGNLTSELVHNENDTEESQLLNEDDNDKAPSFKIIFDKARQIQGTVFLDNPTAENPGGVGQKKLGNGYYDQEGEGKEKTISGVEVKLYKYNEETKKLEEPCGKTYYTSPVNENDKITIDGKNYYYNKNGKTAEDGEFVVTDFIPGNYKLVYIWGNGEYSVENYKGTIWTEENRAEKYVDKDTPKDERKDWYINQTKDKDEKVIRFTDAKDDLNMINEETMNSYTNELSFGIDLEDVKDKKDGESSIQTNSKLIGDSIKYVIDNVDFGIIEKAKQSLAISKKVENIKIVLANGQTIIDANFDEEGNLIGIPKGVNYKPDKDKNSPIWISLDSELIQGAKADITYKITLNNNSEKDYTGEDYYWYGKTDDSKLIKLKPAGVYDYLDSSMVLNPDSNKIENNGEWKVKALDEYNNNIQNSENKKEPTIIEQYLHEQYLNKTDDISSTVKGYELFDDIYKEANLDWTSEKIVNARKTRLKNKTILHNEELEKEVVFGGKTTVTLKASKVLSNKDDIELKNDTEIVKISNVNDSTGSTNIVPIVETLYDKSENIIISTNPGRTDYTIEIVQIILICLIIVTVEIILVKKKIVR